MICYVPAPQAEAMSTALWALSRPPQVREAGDTSAMFSSITDTMGAKWLLVDTEFEIPVHGEAGLAAIGEILLPYVNEGQLPSTTVADLQALVVSKRGTVMKPWDFFPTLFRDMSKTHAEMIDAGLLARPSDAV